MPAFILPALAIGRMIYSFGQAMREARYRELVRIALITVCTGTVVYRYLEGWSWLDATYFSVVTLTTVGYGDVTPQTTIGKIFTIGYILTGIGIIAAFISTVAEQARSRMHIRRRSANAPPKPHHTHTSHHIRPRVAVHRRRKRTTRPRSASQPAVIAVSAVNHHTPDTSHVPVSR